MNNQEAHQLLQSYGKFLEEFLRESDRGAVLAGAAVLDDLLGRLIGAYFADCNASGQLLEGFNAPIGTFSARMKLAHALGLLTQEELSDLETIRKIRNAFAHEWNGVALDSDRWTAVCRTLVFKRTDLEAKEQSARACFNCASAILATRLMARFQNIRRLPILTEQDLAQVGRAGPT